MQVNTEILKNGLGSMKLTIEASDYREAVDKELKKKKTDNKNGCVSGDCVSGYGTYIYSNGNKYVEQVREITKDEDAGIVIVSASFESQVVELEDVADRMEFLESVGLEEPGLNMLIRAAYDLLDLQTYFTAGVKEVRAWTIHKGDTAPQAAGVIHTDFERGFIRAEVIGYDDFITLESETAAKQAGKMAIEGKEYIVKDGDVMHFLFNV